MADWYRRKTWTKTDEEEYFAKLGRARKDGRAQYLRVQAIELIETKCKYPVFRTTYKLEFKDGY